MKQHLEEDHPGIMINILNNRKANPIGDGSDDERLVEEIIDEDAFTEVVYLEEETKRKRKAPLALSKRRKTIDIQDRPRVEFKEYKNTLPTPEPARPEIDSFLNYIGVLLRNVPKEAFPKLQLDVISLVLNAQMASSSVVDINSVSMNNTGEYQITIENKEPPTG